MLLKRIGGVLAILAVAGCGCESEPPSPPTGADAARPRDAGRRDGGRDSGPSDAGRDSGDATHEPDAGPGPYPEAGWIPLPDLPSGCVIERAQHPEMVFMPTWVPCPEPLVECEMMPYVDGQRWAFYPRNGAHDGTRGYFALYQSTDRAEPRFFVIGATDGPPAGAWRMPPPLPEGLCVASTPGLSPDAAGFLLSLRPPDGRYVEHLYHGSYDEIGRAAAPRAVLDHSVLAGAGSTQHLRVSATTAAAEVQPGGYVMIFEDERIRRIAALETLGGIPQSLAVVGSHVMWIDWRSRSGTRIAHASIDEEPTILLSIPDGDIKGFATDGASFAWQQGYNPAPVGPYERVELWTSPYARRREDLRPRFVVEFPVGALATYNSGVYAWGHIVDGEHPLYFYDIADGRRRTLILPDGWGPYAEVLYVHEGELLLGVASAAGQTLFRMRLDAIPYDDERSPTGG